MMLLYCDEYVVQKILVPRGTDVSAENKAQHKADAEF